MSQFDPSNYYLTYRVPGIDAAQPATKSWVSMTNKAWPAGYVYIPPKGAWGFTKGSSPFFQGAFNWPVQLNPVALPQLWNPKVSPLLYPSTTNQQPGGGAAGAFGGFAGFDSCFSYFGGAVQDNGNGTSQLIGPGDPLPIPPAAVGQPFGQPGPFAYIDPYSPFRALNWPAPGGPPTSTPTNILRLYFDLKVSYPFDPVSVLNTIAPPSLVFMVSAWPTSTLPSPNAPGPAFFAVYTTPLFGLNVLAPITLTLDNTYIYEPACGLAKNPPTVTLTPYFPQGDGPHVDQLLGQNWPQNFQITVVSPLSGSFFDHVNKLVLTPAGVVQSVSPPAALGIGYAPLLFTKDSWNASPLLTGAAPGNYVYQGSNRTGRPSGITNCYWFIDKVTGQPTPACVITVQGNVGPAGVFGTLVATLSPQPGDNWNTAPLGGTQSMALVFNQPGFPPQNQGTVRVSLAGI